MKNSWQFIILFPVMAIAAYILVNLGEMQRFAQQCANGHSGADNLYIGFIALGIIGCTVGFIMVIKKKIVLALAALILVSVAFYGYYVLDKIECEHCAKA